MESQTYVVVCRQGRRKDECPLIAQGRQHCVECPYVGYILRERQETSEENSERPQNEEQQTGD